MPDVRRLVNSALALIVAGGAAACADSPSGPSGGGGGNGGGGGTPQTATAIVVGDIGMCGREAVAQTARLVAGLEGTLLLAGDIAYPQGSAANFRDCFHPSWGQFRSRWYAVPGNHEYDSAGAAPYFAYFGEAAGTDGTGYYAVRLGQWLVLMLNSNIAAGVRSPQYEFARTELAAQRTPCTMAVWHHPLFTSGPNRPNPSMRDLFALLESSRTEVIVNGHDHLYERFARQSADGRLNPAAGVRQFIVGTGGADLYGFIGVADNSEERIMRHGVLRLTLHPAQVGWEFHTIDGAVLDRGLDVCH
jgi:hypothetical protein